MDGDLKTPIGIQKTLTPHGLNLLNPSRSQNVTAQTTPDILKNVSGEPSVNTNDSSHPVMNVGLAASSSMTRATTSIKTTCHQHLYQPALSPTLTPEAQPQNLHSPTSMNRPTMQS